MTTSSEPIRALHARLMHEHQEIDAALGRLVEAYESGEHQVARLAFRDFDKRLTAHLSMEDEVLLPAFARFDRLEADAIAAEHRAIRAKVDELVVGSDLHLTRLPAVQLLADALRAHARHEDDSLYRWIDQTYGDSELPSVSEAQPQVSPSH